MNNPEDILKKVYLLQKDCSTAKFTRDQLREKHSALFKKSPHLFDEILKGKLDMDSFAFMMKKMKQMDPSQPNFMDEELKDIKSKDDLENVNFRTTREVGNFMAKKFLKNAVGDLPELSRDREFELIQKIQKQVAEGGSKDFSNKIKMT